MNMLRMGIVHPPAKIIKKLVYKKCLSKPGF